MEADRHTDMLTAILCTPPGGEVKNTATLKHASQNRENQSRLWLAKSDGTRTFHASIIPSVAGLFMG